MINNEGFVEECEEGNFVILMINKKFESERLFDDNSNGNDSNK